MHYKNGREAKVGDQVVGRDCCNRVLAGVLVEITPGTNTCNGRVIQQAAIDTSPFVTLSECVNANDIMELNPPAKQE